MTAPAVGLVAKLQQFLAGRVPVRLDEAGAARAAVALVVADEADPALLFVKRRVRAGDPWSGHAAFPGGYRTPADASPRATAERETLEETGLALARHGRYLGQLDDVYPRSVHLPRLIVTPVVFAVPGRLDVRPSDEIERAEWVRASDVFDSANRRPLVVELPSGGREFTSIRAGGLTIWGLTERIIYQVESALSEAR